MPHHDLDRVLFGDGAALPLAEFRARTAALTTGPGGWVVDGNYSKLADVTWHRADVVVWLDYPLPLIVWRVTRRNLRILAGREDSTDAAFGWRRAFLGRRSVLSNAVRKYFGNLQAPGPLRHRARCPRRSPHASPAGRAGVPGSFSVCTPFRPGSRSIRIPAGARGTADRKARDADRGGGRRGRTVPRRCLRWLAAG